MRLRSLVLVILAAVGCVAAPAAARAADAGDADGWSSQRYRPRSHPRRVGGPRAYVRSRGNRPRMVTQFALGVYVPSGPSGSSFLLDARVGPQVNPHLQTGLMIDWAHRADRVSSTFGGETVGGVDLSLEDSRLRGRSDLVPLLAFVQVNGDDRQRVIPYGGFGAGYEILSLTADRTDGSRFAGTFGGWAWQLWAGAGLPLASDLRFNGELFYNHADLGRDVLADGRPLRQTASFDGPGLRFGLAWGF